MGTPVVLQERQEFQVGVSEALYLQILTLTLKPDLALNPEPYPETPNPKPLKPQTP